MKNGKIFSSSTLWGILLIVAGSLFLLDSLNMYTIAIKEYLISWPSFFIVWGLLKLNNDRGSLLGYMFVIFGSFYMFAKVFPFIHLGNAVFIPAFFIITGLWVLLKPAKEWEKDNFGREVPEHKI